MFQSWFDSKINTDYPAAQGISEPLLTLLADDNSTPEKAISGLASTDFTQRDASWSLWCLLFDAAAEIPESHQKLIPLLLELQTHREVLQQTSAQTDGAATFFDKLGFVWRDRRDVYYAWRDGSTGPWKNAVTSYPEDTRSRPDRKWVNFNAFSAKLLAASTVVGAEFIIFALVDLCNTLECKPEQYYSDFRARTSRLGGAVLSPEQSLATDVLAVAQWAIHPGSKLLHQGIKLFEGDEDDAAEQEQRHRMMASDTDLWEGASGFNTDRWAFWKSRFQFMAEFDHLHLEARNAAAEAFEAMNT